jgi:hypothetical protein
LFILVLFFNFGGAPDFLPGAPTCGYLKRTVTLVSTDAFCTGMWIGMVFCPFPIFVLFFHCDTELGAS